MEDVFRVSPMELSIDTANPRRHNNPAQKEIKRSIFADKGAKLVFIVSRESESSPWFVIEGGTRLQVAKELFAESDGTVCSTVLCVPITWGDVASRTVSALLENVARGDISFIEHCLSIRDCHEQWMASNCNKEVTDTAFLQYLKEQGLSLSKSVYSRYKAATELAPLFPKWLLGGRANENSVRVLLDTRPKIIHLICNQDLFGIAFDMSKSEAQEFYCQVLSVLAEKHDAEDLNPHKFMKTLATTIAKKLNIAPTEFAQHISGKKPKEQKPSSSALQRIQEQVTAATPDWKHAAQTIGVEYTFEGALLLFLQLEPSEYSSLSKLLCSANVADSSHVA